MERREPVRGDEDPASGGAQDWGNVRFRPTRRGSELSTGTPDDNAESRFWIGVTIFLAVAFANPWYSYWVNTRLLGWELQAAAEEFDRQVEASTREMQQRVATSNARREAQSRQQRIGTVRVVGAVPGRNGPVVIVQFGRSNLPEAGPVICRQASVMMGRSLVGEVLRLQTHRGDQPALDAGTVRC